MIKLYISKNHWYLLDMKKGVIKRIVDGNKLLTGQFQIGFPISQVPVAMEDAVVAIANHNRESQKQASHLPWQRDLRYHKPCLKYARK